VVFKKYGFPDPLIPEQMIFYYYSRIPGKHITRSLIFGSIGHSGEADTFENRGAVIPGTDGNPISPLVQKH
jgi:hypothetical protein